MALTKPGLLGGTAATGYPSIWGQASGGQGILGYTPPGFTPGVGVGAPMPPYKAAAPIGGTPYGNYVRQWPDLMKAFHFVLIAVQNKKMNKTYSQRLTKYKNNSGFCAKFKVRIFEQSLVLN